MSVFCSHCHEEINVKSDLIVTSSFFQYNAYHEHCYKYIQKTSRFYANKQVNGYQVIWTVTFFILMFLINMNTPSFKAEPVIQAIWLGFILIALLERLISYVKFERKIKKSAA